MNKAFKRYLWRYRDNSKKRGLIFELTVEQFLEITEKDCFYCGAAPRKINEGNTYRESYFGNGVDRIDPSLGYLYANCQPCCSICNKMKANIGHDEFVAQCHKIVRHTAL